MKPPVSLDALTEEWAKDAPIDITEPSQELAKIPKLHAKYLSILSYHKLKAAKLQSDYAQRKAFKLQYYKGDFNNPEDLKQFGIEPFYKSAGKDIGIYLDQDKELVDLLLKKVIHQEVVDFCSAIVKELNNRTFQLKSIIDWERFVGIK